MKPAPMDIADLERGRVNEPLVRVTGLDHLVLESPNLAAAERFFCDFGLVSAERTGEGLALRAAEGPRQVLKLVAGGRGRLVSIAVRVGSELELRKLASLAEATPLDDANGARRVRLTAPGGLVFEVTSGAVEPVPSPPAPSQGNVTGRFVRVGTTVRVPPAASHVVRLGHVALETTRPRALVLWLLRTLGMIVSDYQYLDGLPSSPMVSFLRCDRGSTPTDHHTLAIAAGPHTGLAHVAFEVRDLDDIGRGAALLRARGHRHAWGIGRHILGSQLFDYWRSPEGFVVEHYCDGDVFDASVPTGRMPFLGSTLAQWGQPPTLDFALPPLTPASLIGAARAVAASDELTVAVLTKAARALRD